MKSVLVCALDWGLGHASRSVPVVRELERQRARVVIASSGGALELLRQEFPHLESMSLPGYAPVYPVSAPMVLKLLPQLPHFVRTVRREHDEVERVVREQSIDVIISDNRYGCRSRSAKSVFITHQAKVLMPSGYEWFSPWINAVCQKHIRRFDEIWIPDQPGSGLTAPFAAGLPNQKAIGWLSRFEKQNGHRPTDGIIAVVSGPDPQRRIFWELVLKQLKELGRRALLVSGEPGKNYRYLDGCVEVVNHLGARDLADAIAASAFVISRSGYSTVMDLIAMGKRAIFVPTPQQPEQLFLAKFLKEKGIAYSEEQDEFSLARSLHQADGFRGLGAFDMRDDLLKKEVLRILS